MINILDDKILTLIEQIQNETPDSIFGSSTFGFLKSKNVLALLPLGLV